MLDVRIITFLKLCQILNYRITANELNITQPAVTQHIKYLEQKYNCKLFDYSAKKLSLTNEARILKQYCESALSNETDLLEKLTQKDKIHLRIGTTKTIGEYVITDKLIALARNPKIQLDIIVDNTEKLLELLQKSQINIALVEGSFPKSYYSHKLMKKEELIGICSKYHKFYNKEVTIEEVLNEIVICREKGSGTRAVLEQFLQENNYSINNFNKDMSISSFKLIKKMVKSDCGISFVFESVANSDLALGTFRIKGSSVRREFNYVFLKNTIDKEIVKILEEDF